MKKLFSTIIIRYSKIFLSFLIAIILTTSVNAQNYNPYTKEWKYKETVKTLAVYGSSIILSAVGDGFNDDGNKIVGHACNALSTGLLVASPFILDVDKSNWGWYAASYISLRIGMFDTSYNITRGLPIGYVGNSSIWDKAVRQTKSPEASIMAGRSLFLLVGFTIPINEF